MQIGTERGEREIRAEEEEETQQIAGFGRERHDIRTAEKPTTLTLTVRLEEKNKQRVTSRRSLLREHNCRGADRTSTTTQLFSSCISR